MGDIAESIVKIIYTNNMHMFFKTQKYGGGVSDYLDDNNIVSAHYYIDRHIVQEALTLLNNNGMVLGQIYSNISFPEYVKVSTNNKEAYCVKPLNCAEKVENKIIVIIGKYEYKLYHYFQTFGYIVISFGEMAQYSAYKNIVMNFINHYITSKEAVSLYFKFPQANRIVNKSKLEKFLSDNGIYGFDNRAKNYGLDESMVVHQPILKTIERNGIIKFEDVSERGINVRNGFRVTTDQPNSYDKTCWIFGSSVVRGVFADDYHTIASQLQRKFNDVCPNRYRVVNASNYSGNCIWDMVKLIQSLPIEKGDICVFDLEFPISLVNKDQRIIDLSKEFERPHNYGEVFIDINHMTGNGYCIQGDIIFSYIQKYLSNEQSLERKTNDVTYSESCCDSEDIELSAYINKIKKYTPKIGAIVMNCNPFTLGHRYLIETAIKQVDRLYIFVVQEDTSEFSFEERYEMVRLGTQDFDRITILPSGNYIISRKTFPAYSQKAQLQDEVINPSLDVELFGKKIAPALGINVRFAGEEPLDKVTKQYNEAMREILPEYGIQFVEISRKRIGDEVISASRVRQLLRAHEIDELKKIVPLSTYLYIEENNLYDCH